MKTKIMYPIPLLSRYLLILWIGGNSFACKKKEEPDTDPRIVPVSCFTEHSANNGRVIEGEYIVQYKPDKETKALRSFENSAGRARTILHRNRISTDVIRVVLHQGFVCHLRKEEVALLQKDPGIDFIEPDRMVSIAACLTVVDTNTIAWGVQRVGYGDGTGRTAWVIDSGIDTDHEDLNIDLYRSQCFIQNQTSVEDLHGHGTHVAGIIGARNNTIGTVGVAAGATLVALKVLDQLGEGRVSALVAALEYIDQHASRGDVVNMSLVSDTISKSIDQMVLQIVNKGVLFAIASGNNAKPATYVSPSHINHPNVFTVAAMDKTDTWATFSNYGSSVVDVAAPGVDILSTYLNNGYAVMSGTSSAAPHLAGLLLLDGRNFGISGQVIGDPDPVAAPIPHKQ